MSGHAAKPRDLFGGIASDAAGEKRFISVVAGEAEAS
jgi:hypothetical protein